MSIKRERRSFVLPIVDVRAAETDGRRYIEGHAAVFDSLSEDLWGFKEKIAYGAFSTTIAEDDVVGLFNHDPNHVLGRKSSGTLELREEQAGLWFRCYPPDTVAGRDVLTLCDRQDLRGCSFSFMTRQDAWNKLNGEWVRTLLDVQLFDVGPVTFPAYSGTDVQARSAEAGLWIPTPPAPVDDWRTEVFRARQTLAEIG